MKRGAVAPMVLSVLLGSSTAQLNGNPHNFQSTSILWSQDLKVEFVNTPQTLQWAVGNGTEVIVIEQHLDLCAAAADVDVLKQGALHVLDAIAIQGACAVTVENPTGVCTLDVCEHGFQMNPGTAVGAQQHSEKLLLSNLRIRQSQCGDRTTVVPALAQTGLIAVAKEQLWLQNVFLEGTGGARGLDVQGGVALYMEGGSVTDMTHSGQGPAFSLCAGSSARFSRVTFANMQLSGNVTPEVLQGYSITQEGRYGLLGQQAAASTVAFDNCRLQNVTVNGTVQGVEHSISGAAVDSGASLTVDGAPAVPHVVPSLEQKTSDSSAARIQLLSSSDSWFLGMLQKLEDAKLAHAITQPSRVLLEAQTESISGTSDAETTDSGLGIVPSPGGDSATVEQVDSNDVLTPGPGSDGLSDSSSNADRILVTVAAVGSLILVALVVLLCCLARRQRRRLNNRRKKQADLTKADGGTAATCGTSAELENRIKNLSDLQRWSPHNTIENSHAASCHSQASASQGPYLPVPWLHSGPQTGQPPRTHSPSDLAAHPPLGNPAGSLNGVRIDDPYHVPNGVNFESGRTDVHRDVNDPEYIENGTVEPQLCDFPPFPPAHLPDIDPALEEAKAVQASQHLPAPSSSEPSTMGQSQSGAKSHLHPGKTGHAQVGPQQPNPAAAWNLSPYKGDGSSFDAASSQREVNSKQPLLPQNQPSGTSTASTTQQDQNQNHGGPSRIIPVPVVGKPKAQPAPTAFAAPQSTGQQAADSQQDGEGRQGPAAVAGQERDVVPLPVPHPHPQAQGEGGLIEALDQYAANGTLLFDRYVVRGAQDRRFGGQGVVQFAQDPHTQEQYAIKFFTKRQGFERERKLYDKTALRSMMPAVIEVVPNADNRYATADGFVFPPCLVVERGESLDEWARRIEPGFLTILSVLCDVATRLQQLHHAGYVHRDVKPGNVLWRPTQFSWTLIDFGCAAAIGTQCGLSFSLLYAPPEVIQSVESQARGMRADPKTDMWAMGVIAYELLTRTRIFPPSLTRAEVRDRIAGRVPLPWEEPEAKASGHRQLRILKHTVLACLNRDPSARPTAAKLLRSWNRIFDTFSAGSGGVGTTTNVLAGRQPQQP